MLRTKWPASVCDFWQVTQMEKLISMPIGALLCELMQGRNFCSRLTAMHINHWAKNSRMANPGLQKKMLCLKHAVVVELYG